MKNRICILIIILSGFSNYALSQDIEIQADSSEIRLIDESGTSRIGLLIQGLKTALIFADSEGSERARIGSSSGFIIKPNDEFTDGEFGALMLRDDNGNPSVTALGGSTIDGLPALLTLSADSAFLKLKTPTSPKAVELFAKSNKSGVVLYNPEGNSVAQIITTEDGESGIFALDNDQNKVTVFAQGGSSESGAHPMIRITGDSSSLTINESNNTKRLNLFVSDSQSGLILSTPDGTDVAQMTTSENGKSGSIEIRDSETNAYVFSGFESLGGDRHPIIAMNGDSSVLQVTSDPYDGNVKVYANRDQAGIEIIRPVSSLKKIAELRSDIQNRFGILQLHNATNTGSIVLVAGGDGHRTSMYIEEDTSSIELFSYNSTGTVTLGKKADKTFLQMTNGTIELHDLENATDYVQMGKDEFGGRFTLDNLESKSLLRLSTGVNGEYGSFELLGANGSQNILATSLVSSDNHGGLSILNDQSHSKVDALASSQGHGVVQLWGENGNANIRLTSLDGASNRALLSIHNTAGVERAGGYINISEKGVLFAEDFSLLTSNGVEQTVFVNSSGQRVISGDVKNFSMDHPKQEGKEIWFACIEGPEVAAYARGTASLDKGEAIVNLPTYFSEIVEEEGITLTITPLSADSKGIAVVAKSVDHFSVKELFQGNGNYQFDWEIKAVRSGFENYKVVRDKPQKQSANFQKSKHQLVRGKNNR